MENLQDSIPSLCPIMRGGYDGIIAVIPTFDRDAIFVSIPMLLAWYDGLRIIVVDNGSAHELSKMIAAQACNRVEVVRLDENRGGSGGYIAGMKRALELDGEFVWLLDDDAEPNEETLPGLIATYCELVERGEPVASVGSTIVSKSNPDAIVECGAKYLKSPRRVEISRVLNGELLSKHGKETIQVEYCAGCSSLIHRTSLEKVGPWEDVFIHYDDVEWGLRAEHRFGLKNFATTVSTVVHPDRGIVEEESGTKCYPYLGHEWIQYYDTCNKLWVDQMYAPKTFQKEYFICRMYEVFAKVFFLNHGKYYAYRQIMTDFRAGKRQHRSKIVSLFASHGIMGDLRLLSLPRWYVWLRKHLLAFGCK